jgi:hypothetical protein
LGIRDEILNPEKKQIGHQVWDFEPRKNKLGIKDGILNPEKTNWASKMGY